jgi:hypothetical protein
MIGMGTSPTFSETILRNITEHIALLHGPQLGAMRLQIEIEKCNRILETNHGEGNYVAHDEWAMIGAGVVDFVPG